MNCQGLCCLFHVGHLPFAVSPGSRMIRGLSSVVNKPFNQTLLYARACAGAAVSCLRQHRVERKQSTSEIQVLLWKPDNGALIPETSRKPIPVGPKDSPEVFGGGCCWVSLHMRDEALRHYLFFVLRTCLDFVLFCFESSPEDFFPLGF